jgi:hypothetical protein
MAQDTCKHANKPDKNVPAVAATFSVCPIIPDTDSSESFNGTSKTLRKCACQYIGRGCAVDIQRFSLNLPIDRTWVHPRSNYLLISASAMANAAAPRRP